MQKNIYNVPNINKIFKIVNYLNETVTKCYIKMTCKERIVIGIKPLILRPLLSKINSAISSHNRYLVLRLNKVSVISFLNLTLS